ncbi:hypothetical protein NQ314_004604 [Rhamnusium bicolor]|uniref:Nucleoporin NUP35 n=1 Tax=Rhamnusium bicolor TaxID=1586634 RepID=A0AAV8ZKW3_9CUCU|nr:hypothetical protein NQ314_004604 [Rhamnusium bicolor]
MTLGSAPSSPASPGINPNFLPGFLMGGETQPNTPNPNTSPGRNRTSGSFSKMGLSTTEPRSLQQKKKPTSPIMSSTVAHFNDSVGFNESVSRIHNEDSLNYSRSALGLSETFNRANNISSSRIERIDSHWVTVFGFPPSALTLVLSHLANCGPIADKKIPPQGNWVHIKFNNLSEVSRALSLNGKLINNSIMIGVQPHYNKENKENDNTIYTSPIRARSLRHSFVSPQSPNTVVPPQTVPQKSTGIVTKAMEYVFGW